MIPQTGLAQPRGEVDQEADVLFQADLLADLLLEFGILDDFLEFFGQLVVPVRLGQKGRQLLADFHELAQGLDLIGDFYMLNLDLSARIVATKAGHALNAAIVREILNRRAGPGEQSDEDLEQELLGDGTDELVEADAATASA